MASKDTVLVHKHLLIRAEVKKPLVNKNHAIKYLRKMIKAINMKAMYGPTASYCKMPGNKGLTAFAIIETSHIAFHSWDETNPALVQLDVYTCSELDEQTVFDWMTPFSPKEIKWKYYDRENNLQLVKEA